MTQTIKLFITTLSLFASAGLFVSCDDNEPIIENSTGSVRDWRYSPDQVQMTIDGDTVTSLKEIWVSSASLDKNDPDIDSLGFEPEHKMAIQLTGWPHKKDKTVLRGWHNIDRLAGNVTTKGITYNVEGEYIGNPFHHYTEFRIILRLTARH